MEVHTYYSFQKFWHDEISVDLKFRKI